MPTSDSHHIAVMKQDNGELQEDVVERDLVEADPGSPGGAVDRQSVESFPASDAPSSWAGPPQGTGAEGGRAPGGDMPPGDRAEGAAGDRGRVVESRPAPEVPEREHPADPLPGTLPRRPAG